MNSFLENFILQNFESREIFGSFFISSYTFTLLYYYHPQTASHLHTGDKKATINIVIEDVKDLNFCDTIA